ncbi:MAG: hypothetical protein OXT65_00165 [Alphaproteobacteria bacterium]|nr:hypothetical protein [Alphaproteobacteria bacterium]
MSTDDKGKKTSSPFMQGLPPFNQKKPKPYISRKACILLDEWDNNLKIKDAQQFPAAKTVLKKLVFADVGSEKHEDEILAMIESGASPHATKESTDTYTALHRAALKSYDRLVAKLLTMDGVDVNEKGFVSHETPLHVAVRLAGNKRVIAQLLAGGADLDALTTSNETPEDCAKDIGHHDYAAMIDNERRRRLQEICDRGTPRKRTIRRRPFTPKT